MKGKTSETVRMVDQFAEMAHEMVDRVHELALKIDETVDVRARESTEKIMGKLEGRTRAVEEYIEANPAVVAAIALGLGAYATRFKTTEKPASAASAGKGEASKTGPKAVPKAKVRKAA